jgi:hypothetical protein
MQKKKSGEQLMSLFRKLYGNKNRKDSQVSYGNESSATVSSTNINLDTWEKPPSIPTRDPKERWNNMSPKKNDVPTSVKEIGNAIGFDPIGTFKWMPIWNSYRWSILLRFKRLKKGKIKQILMHKDEPKKVMGILHDHLMKIANIMAIPNVYIKDFLDLRKSLREGLRGKSGTFVDIQRAKLLDASDNLLTAVLQSMEGIDISSLKAI